MENNKDFDFDEFNEFMKYLTGMSEAIALGQRARTFRELEMMDELEVEVAGRPCYTSADEMINAVKEL